MKWTVAYQPSAQNDLTNIWIAASDRAAVSAASNKIDRMLRHDPYLLSDPVDDTSRVLIVSPLGVAFDIRPDDRLVTVWAVWRVP